MCVSIGAILCSSDLAVLKTTSDIQFNSNVQPIALTRSEPAHGTRITVAGYGRDENGNSGILKYATNVKRRCNHDKDAVCQDMKPNSPYFGDSGGPLFIQSGGRYVQVGVVSGERTIGGVTDAMYANVAKHLGFINQ